MKCYEHTDVEATGTCTNCGKAVCPGCSVELNGKLLCKPCAGTLAARPASWQASANRKEPALAMLLSLVGGLACFMFIGLGQIYNGQVKKGILLIALNIVISVAVFILYMGIGIVTLGVGFICCLPILIVPLCTWFYAVYDAYMTADKINRGEPVKDWLD